jgi:uncharacterized protein YecT (DUF1311 family)
MKLFSLGVALVCFEVGLMGFAQTTEETKQGSSGCEDAVTTAAMRACEDSRYQIALRELNAAYQSLMKTLDRGHQQKLRLAERAWLRFRDTSADFQASRVQGGTLAPLVRITILTDMTKARTQELSKSTLP